MDKSVRVTVQTMKYLLMFGPFRNVKHPASSAKMYLSTNHPTWS
jgi:hypothetical protein